MDVDLPGEDGASATRRITSALPHTTVVMLTAYDDTDRLLEAIKAGAQGYLLKNIRSTELLEQLRGLAAGEAPISRRMATRMLQEFRRGQADDAPEPDGELTARELEVLKLVAALKNILAKLHLHSRGRRPPTGWPAAEYDYPRVTARPQCAQLAPSGAGSSRCWPRSMTT